MFSNVLTVPCATLWVCPQCRCLQLRGRGTTLQTLVETSVTLVGRTGTGVFACFFFCMTTTPPSRNRVCQAARTKNTWQGCVNVEARRKHHAWMIINSVQKTSTIQENLRQSAHTLFLNACPVARRWKTRFIMDRDHVGKIGHTVIQRM